MHKPIIHQIAPKDSTLWHPFWSKCHDSWKEHYEVLLWNDEDDIDAIVKNDYTAYWNLYQSFPFHVMRIDFVRLCILHKYGGLYADMDMFCYQHIPEEYFSKPFVALENLTEEYTSAKYENSMMYSEKNNPFLLNMMNYIKMLFINSRSNFEKPYRRTVKNDNLINNITGSGILEAGAKSFGQDNVGFFPCALFNNRPASYDPLFYTKHAHSSIWGKEYINKQNYNQLVFMDGVMYQVDKVSDTLKELIQRESNYITTTHDFNFRFDYTDGRYLKPESDLAEVNKHIRNAMMRFNDYFTEAYT